MIRADDAPLYQRPETFDGVGMNVAMHVFPCAVAYHPMRKILIKVAIADMVISRNQADFMRYGFIDETVKRCRIRAINHAGDHISLALDRTDYNAFAVAARATHVPASAFAFVLVLGFAADIGLIYFYIANHLAEFDVTESNTNLVAHHERGFVGTEPHHAEDLKCANALLAGKHHVHDPEPIPQWFIGILEDRADQQGKAVSNAAIGALIAIPVKRCGMYMDDFIAAARAAYALWPAVIKQVILAGGFVWKLLLELRYTHLVYAVVQGFRCFLGYLHGLAPIKLEPV